MVFLRILLLLFVILIGYILFLCICALLVNPKKEYDKESRFYRAVLNGASALAMRIMRIKVHTSGLEDIPTDRKFLFVSNHRSNFDPIITWLVFKKNRIAYVSKAENFKIPIFGRLIRKCCFMTIDRESPRAAIGTINHSAELLARQEVSIGIYPEGTRAKDGVMLPFHNGVFRIAQKAGADIVLLSISGTEKIHKNFPFHRSHIYLNVVEIIPNDVVQKTRTSDIGERARQAIENNLIEHTDER